MPKEDREFQLAPAGQYNIVYYPSNNGKYKMVEGFVNDNGFKDGKWIHYYDTPPEKAFWFYEGLIERLEKIENYKNGILDGEYITWYHSGIKSSEGFYKKGKLDGKFTRWSEYGHKLSEQFYANGKLNGDYKSFDGAGEKISTSTYHYGIKSSEKRHGMYNPVIGNLVGIMGWLFLILASLYSLGYFK